MNRGGLILTMLVMCLSGCYRQSSTHLGEDTGEAGTDSTMLFKNIISKIDTTEIVQDRIYVVIPITTCNTCIAPAFEFLKENYTRQEYYKFVITEFKDSTQITSRIGYEILHNHENRILLDYDNYINLLGFYSMYPQIFVIRKGILKRHQQVNYENMSIWKEIAINTSK